MALMADGRIISGSWVMVQEWDLESGRPLRFLAGSTGMVNAVALTADGRIVSGSDDNLIEVSDLEKGRLLRLLVGHTGTVRAVA